MRYRDPRDRDYDPRDNDRDRRWADRRDHDDYGQADYSSDYRYDPERRAGYRASEQEIGGADYGQADFSDDYGYDARTRRGYRRQGGDDYVEARGLADPDRDHRARLDADRDYPRRDEERDEPRTWRDRMRSASWFGGESRRPADDDEREERTARRRRGPSDRVLWAEVTGRLGYDRRLDSSDIHVHVHNGEVTLDGTVRNRDDKRRAEDLADLPEVRHVQNNLRVRQRSRWAFI